MSGTKVAFEAVKELAFGGISGTYATVGAASTDHTRLISFTNTTDQDLYISFNGSTDHLRIAASSFKLLDLTANRVSDQGLFFAVGTQVYVKQVSSGPTVGSFWVEIMYAEGGV